MDSNQGANSLIHREPVPLMRDCIPKNVCMTVSDFKNMQWGSNLC